MASFSRLPLEVLSEVCEYLDYEHRPSLCKLALVNKRCYAAAKEHRFSRIRFVASYREQLKEEIEKCTKFLETVSGFGSVRAVAVVGSLPDLTTEDGEFEPDLELCCKNGPVDELTDLSWYYADSMLFHNSVKPRQETSTDGWPALAELLSKMHGLKELLWGCTVQLPWCILQTLHIKLPQCKLHVMGLSPASAFQNKNEPSDLEDRDVALVTSPNLSSVLFKVGYTDPTDSAAVEYSEEIALELASGLAPNLKALHIFYDGITEESDDELDERPSWRGLCEQQQKNKDNGSHTSNLQHWGLKPALCEFLKIWENHVDFSKLRSLQLWNVSAEGLEFLMESSFDSLTALALSLSPGEQGYGTLPEGEVLRVDEAASSFISMIESPLESVHLGGVYYAEETLQALLEHHGSSLRTLSMMSSSPRRKLSSDYGALALVVTADDVNQIQDYCPDLRDLRLTVAAADFDEEDYLELFEAIGGCERLTEVSIMFDLAAVSAVKQLFKRDGVDNKTPGLDPGLPIGDWTDGLGGPEVSAAVQEWFKKNVLHKSTTREPTNKELAHEIFIAIRDAGASSLQRVHVDLNCWIVRALGVQSGLHETVTDQI
ncbi:hypothetical protein BJX64DRAFT_292495 [Aspergillus heterothallicus]